MLQAIATLKCVLEKSANHMPHHMHTLPFGEKMVSKVLSATFLWKETLPEVNAANVVFGLKEVSTSNINKIKKLNFPKYCVKKLEDNFARCAVCDRFYTQRRTYPIGLQRKWDNLLEKHNACACAHRDLYYANHTGQVPTLTNA